MRLSPAFAAWSLAFGPVLGLWSGGCAAGGTGEPADDDAPGQGGSIGVGGAGGAITTGGSTSATGGTQSASGGTTSATGGAQSATGGTSSGNKPPPVTAGPSMETCGMAVGAAADLLIDDLEDGDNTVGNGAGAPQPPARVGYWFTYNEKTDNPGSSCSQLPPPDPQGLLPFPPTANPGNGSMFGAHTSGSSCTATWGAGIGVDFNNCNTQSNPYSGAAYRGISFWYKSTQPIRALVSTTPNLPTAEGGQCSANCYNHHGKNFAAAPAGTMASITWAELGGTAQIGSPAADPQTYGDKRAFDPSKLIGMQVQVDQQGGANFDLWLDDLTFQ